MGGGSAKSGSPQAVASAVFGHEGIQTIRYSHLVDSKALTPIPGLNQTDSQIGLIERTTMSEETIVNRVQQTSHFASEGRKLEVAPFSPEQIESVVIDPIVESVYNELVAEKAQTAEASRAGQVGSFKEDFGFPVPEEPIQDWSMSPAAVAAGHVAEEPDDNIGNVIGNSIVDVEALRRALSLGYDQPESYAQFRTKVIASFKHLGLDTRKHFGE